MEELNKMISGLPRHFVRVLAVVTGNHSPSTSTFTPNFGPDDIQPMIEQANAFLDPAGIELVFDPNRNIKQVHNSFLNDKDPVANEVKNGQERLAFAARCLTKLVIFFSDQTFGFSGPGEGDAPSFVSLPKGVHAGDFVAHELGHYFHLSHPFHEVANIAEAAQTIKQFVEAKAGNNLPINPTLINKGLDAFDADAGTITDTPPDLGARIYLTAACDPDPARVRLNIPVTFKTGQTGTYVYNPPRLNVMSSFHPCAFPGLGFSPQQILRMRNTLENLNNRHLTMVQDNWRFCRKCQGLFFGGISAKATCAMAGSHDGTGSFDYTLIFNSNQALGQSNWRFCKQCLGLFFAGNETKGFCVKKGGHDGSGSGDYTLLANSKVFGQDDWRWCSVCQSLFFGPKVVKTKCPIFNGMPHQPANSFNYTLIHN